MADWSSSLILTERLRLEPCHRGHLEGLHAINADAEIMRYITGRAETREETAAVIRRVEARWQRWGHSWWVFIEADTDALVGAGCIQHLRKGAEPEPDDACPLEIGWRVRRDRWQRGLATEAARALMDFAFTRLRSNELYAVCDPENLASVAVMKKLGMHSRGLEHWYGRELAAYRITTGEWSATKALPAPDSR